MHVPRCVANSWGPWGDVSHGGISTRPCPIVAGRALPSHSLPWLQAGGLQCKTQLGSGCGWKKD